ncbi:tetratricopeptide repeat protein [Nostoc sp. WHI]|uniref:tetratricopeptide repeat protein n=1 Tax=Nostoc sp. WHI TaxID=2650611 RepID=UPI0018C63E16|nr:tetratricopeptide repeat protein [Nostoc sp. WHI]MBG1268475.1 tetratricopeptide repeat protein [Nostoc sp. WHI]
MLSIPRQKNKIGRKVYISQILVVASTILLLGWSNAWGQVKPEAKRRCKVIGRVTSVSDLRWRVNSLLCSGDRITPMNGRTVNTLCYLNGEFLDFKQSSIFDVEDKCRLPHDRVRLCTGLNPTECDGIKGPTNVPMLISPYGSSMLSTRPVISWYAIPQATSYTVVVSGYEFYWEKTVDKTITALPYPKEQKELQFFNTYKFTVLANVGDTPISSSETLVVSVLRQEEQDAFAERVKQITELNLPPDEAAIWDLDAVFMARNLLNETIESLKIRVAAGSQNPTVYRLLADRYLEAWLPKEALREYKKAAQLAKNTNNLDELARVQEGLKIVEFYNHPPTSTKPDQK